MLKRNLRIVTLLLACSLFLFSACGQPAQPAATVAPVTPAASTPQPVPATPAPTAKPTPTAFATSSLEPIMDEAEFIEYSGDDFTVQYPSIWLAVDADILEEIRSEEGIDNLIESYSGAAALKIAMTLAQADFSGSVSVFWCDTEDSMDPSLHVYVMQEDTGGFTVDMLKSEEFQRGLPDTLRDDDADDFEYTTDIQGKELGNTYFVVYEANVTNENGRKSNFTAITISDTTLYVFDFITPEGKLDVPTYEKMLSTLEFVR